MAVKVTRKGELWCAVDDGGMELKAGCYDTEAEATARMKAENSKLSDEKGVGRKSYVPYGVMSFDDMEAVEIAHEAAERVSELTWNFQDIMWNIMNSDAVEDKPAAIRMLAGEFTDRLEVMTRKKDPTKEKDSAFLYVDEESDARLFKYRDANGDIDYDVLYDAAKSDNAEIVSAASAILFANGKQKNIVTKVVDAVRGFAGKEVANEDRDLRIWKDSNGRYKWVARYSNNFRDEDYPVQEIISKSSHQNFVKLVDEGVVPPPKLMLWHEDSLEFGQADWVAYDDMGFAIAGGHIYDELGELAEVIKSLDDVRMSHGMPVMFIERDEKDNSIITQHITEEITVLPGYAAANKRTGFIMLG
jgi:hypothetical protein